MVENKRLSDLQSIVGAVHARVVDDGYVVDGAKPQVAVSPGSYEEVAAVLQYANRSNWAVVPWGGGTMMYVGNVPQRYDIALDTARLDQIIEHEPADLTVTCQAGITLELLHASLEEAGQMVPLSSAFDPWGTVGGVLAVNNWGPECHAYGFPRDYTIGMRLVTADGGITRAGGKVVKNVAGYDIAKLYIGSLGTLGVIVEATFKVQPLPKVNTQMVVGCDTIEESCGVAREATRRGLSVVSAIIDHYTWQALAKPYLLWLSVAGTHAGVDRALREITDLASESGLESWESPTADKRPGGRPWAKLNAEIEFREVTGIEFKVAVSPRQVAGLVSDLTALGGQLHLCALPTVGLVRADWRNITAAETERLIGGVRAAVGRHGGSALVLFSDLDLKRRIDVFGDPPPAFELMRRVKNQFDPNGILSPGRFAGRL